MQHVPYDAESPIGTLGDITEKDITTKGYKKKLAPEKETDAKLNSERQILSLYQWAANQLRTELFLTREQVCWQGDDVTDGFIGTDGASAHDDIPSDHVLTPGTAFSDHANSTPYDELSMASYLIANSDQGFYDMDAPMDPVAYVSPSVWRDLKLNNDMSDRFSGVEVRGLTGEQVRRLVDSEIPNIREVRVKLPRTDSNGNYVDDQGNIVDDVDDAVYDNVLEPHDGSDNVRNIVIGTPGPQSAFIPFFGENLGDFDDPTAPDLDTGFATDMQRGFMTQTWMSHDPATTWLKAMQDISFHLHLPEHWVVIQDI
jgi:hypothetical protein